MKLQAKEFKWELSVNKWSDVKCSDVEWTNVIYLMWSDFVLKLSEVSYVELLGDKSTLHIRVTVCLKVLDYIVTILFGVYLVLCLF